MIGPPDHLPALKTFADRADAVTVEFGKRSAPALRWLRRRRRVRPGWRTLWICQNRLREKRFLMQHAIPHAPWRPVRDEAELDAAVRDLGLPLILKTAASGYDGKGQVLVEQAASGVRRVGEPGPRVVRRRSVGRFRRRVVGRRGSRRRRPCRLLSGRT